MNPTFPVERDNDICARRAAPECPHDVAHLADNVPNSPAERMCRYLSLRGKQERHLARGLFADPAWDILLDLFVAEHRGLRVSITSACIASMVPTTTALRWIALLQRSGLIARERDRNDRCVANLRLIIEAREGPMRRTEAGLSA